MCNVISIGNLNSTKPEVFVIFCKGQGLGKQPEVKFNAFRTFVCVYLLCHNFKRTVKCQTMFPTLRLEKIITYVRYLIMQMVN